MRVRRENGKWFGGTQDMHDALDIMIGDSRGWSIYSHDRDYFDAVAVIRQVPGAKIMGRKRKRAKRRIY